jgi:hypothetical protein
MSLPAPAAPDGPSIIPPLRALTFIQPMGEAIVVDSPKAKRIENRPKSLPKAMLGRPTVIAVHSGMKFSDAYGETAARLLGDGFSMLRGELKQGVIIGLMELSGRQFTAADLPFTGHHSITTVHGYGSLIPELDPWWGGPFGYEITAAIALTDPVKCRGGLGWWTVPEPVAARVFAQLPEAWVMKAAQLAPRYARRGKSA